MPTIKVDPHPRHAVSPLFYMQFMEPLGTTDSSVAACWDALADRWRDDFVAVVRDLGPGSIRWGGILTSFWKWREGVGDPRRRLPMVNYLWGGQETNRIGVDEFLTFCQAVEAEPVMAVNFAADGRPEYVHTVLGEQRAGTAGEAADLVSYCNDSDSVERRANGRGDAWGVKVWQVGNETSYPPEGDRFTSIENARRFSEFARAMRARDPSIRIIGWGDQERDTGRWWAKDLIAEAGDQVDMVAIHMMHQRPDSEHSILHGRRYRQDYGRTWDALDAIYRKVETKLQEARTVVAGTGSTARLAITEGHLSLQPHNKSELLREWIAGLYHARVMALFERHSDVVDIATLADFAGTTWTVNAVMLGSPREAPYLMPAGHVMRLFKRYSGTHGLIAESSTSKIEVSASRAGDRVFIHLVNTDLTSAVPVAIDLGEAEAHSARWYLIDQTEPSAAIDSTSLDVFGVTETILKPADLAALSVPKASVGVIAVDLSPAT